MRKGSENLSKLKILAEKLCDLQDVLAEKLCDLQDDGADYSFSCSARGRNAIPTNIMTIKIRSG